MDFFDTLKGISKRVEKDVPMKNHTSFKIGGCADYVAYPGSIDEIRAIKKLADEHNVPVTVVGNGSNLLVSDDGIEGVVIKISDAMSEVKVEGCEVFAEAGVLLSTLANRVEKYSLTGLEFASGIPGTLGGAVVMNAGAYGGEMKDVITSVGYMTKDGEVIEADAKECGFGYRKSIFSCGDKTVLYCRMSLKEGNRDEIRALMNELTQRRKDKQPLSLPSAGSTFKRPEGYFAGKLIEDSGLKGFRVGGAEVSRKHSGFVVNIDNATAKDVKNLIAEVQRIVFEKFGVNLEPELKFIGR